jgi:putative copper export protein
MANLWILGIVKFLHDLFTTIWVGGLVTLGITIMPSVKKSMGRGSEANKLMDIIRERLSILVYVSMIGLLVTGLLMGNSSPLYTGVLTVSNEYSILLTIKHLVIAVMVVLAIVRSRVVPRMKIQEMKRNRMGARLTILNMVLGIAVLLLSAFTSAMTLVALSTP